MVRSKNPLYIDWLKSEARIVLLEHLTNGDLSLDNEVESVDAAWIRYSQLPAFKGIVCEKQFKKQLEAHRGQVAKIVNAQNHEVVALEHDLKLHKRSTTNNRGEIMFSRSPAFDLLREDVASKVHVGLTPFQLQKTRIEYEPFDPRVFKHRIYQEIRRVKFVNYLNFAREEKMKAAQKEKEKAILNREALRKKMEKERAKLAAGANGKRRRT